MNYLDWRLHTESVSVNAKTMFWIGSKRDGSNAVLRTVYTIVTFTLLLSSSGNARRDCPEHESASGEGNYYNNYSGGGGSVSPFQFMAFASITISTVLNIINNINNNNNNDNNNNNNNNLDSVNVNTGKRRRRRRNSHGDFEKRPQCSAWDSGDVMIECLESHVKVRASWRLLGIACLNYSVFRTPKKRLHYKCVQSRNQIAYATRIGFPFFAAGNLGIDMRVMRIQKERTRITIVYWSRCFFFLLRNYVFVSILFLEPLGFLPAWQHTISLRPFGKWGRYKVDPQSARSAFREQERKKTTQLTTRIFRGSYHYDHL